jgi:hypothetical protein
MKKIIENFSVCVVIILSIQAARGQSYGPWQTVYESPPPNQLRVQISFALPPCNANSNAHYRINNEFSIQGGRLYFKIDYTDCKGEPGLTPVYVNLDKPGIQENSGWFFRGLRVNHITDIEPPKNGRAEPGAGQNSSFHRNNNDSSEPEQDQQIRQQKAEESRQYEEQRTRQAENERVRRQQIASLNQANEKTGEAWQNVMGGLGSMTDMIMQNMFNNSIQNDNRSRIARFNELQDLVNTKQGTLSNCTNCYGRGYTSCGSCNSSGKKTCIACFGKGNSNCTLCFGTGSFAGSTCGSCGGKGSFQCAICKGSGASYCTDCHATGKSFCTYCRGTGQEFREDYTARSITSGSSKTAYSNSVYVENTPAVNQQTQKDRQEQERRLSEASAKRTELRAKIGEVDSQIKRIKSKKTLGTVSQIIGGGLLIGAIAAEANAGAVGSSPSDPIVLGVPGAALFIFGILKNGKLNRKIKELKQEKRVLQIDLNTVVVN